MRRDIHLVDSASRIRGILAEKLASGADLSSTLGVGCFRGVSLGDTGVEVQVLPSLLKSHFLSEVGRGHVSPFAQEILYFGEASLSVSRWLLIGLQSSSRFRTNGPRGQAALHWPEVRRAQSVSDVLAALWEVVQTRVLDLRAAVVVVVLDFDFLDGFVRAWLGLAPGSGMERRQLIIEVLAWFADEWLHTSTILACENSADYEILIEESRAVRLKAGLAGDLVFRF